MHGHWAPHEKAGSLEQTLMLRKIEGSWERGSPNMRWIGSKKKKKSQRPESAGVEQAYEDITHSLWTSLIHRVTRSQNQLDGM